MLLGQVHSFMTLRNVVESLMRRLEPDASIPEDIETEVDRLSFLALGIVSSRTQLLLRAKPLYTADGHAVRELLKLTQLLLDATRAAEGGGWGQAGDTQNDNNNSGGGVIHLAVRPSEVASIRGSAEEVARQGARLQELLSQEPQLREARASAARLLEALATGPSSSSIITGAGSGAAQSSGGPYEAVERGIRDAAASAADEAAGLEGHVGDLKEDEAGLGGKVAKRQAELGRASRRLESLASIRPAFLDEYHRLEGEMAEEHVSYVTKTRNLDFLKVELERQRKVRRHSQRAGRRVLRW